MEAGREPAWAVLAWQPGRLAFCPPFFTGFPVFPSLRAVTGPAVCSLLYGAHPFMAGMHQPLSGPLNSPNGSREPCRLGSGFGNWSECFEVTTSQHLLKTQTLLFFLTEVSYSGFRILPCVSRQSCLSFPISVRTTQVPGTLSPGQRQWLPSLSPFRFVLLQCCLLHASIPATLGVRSQSRHVLFQSFHLFPAACREHSCVLSLAQGFSCGASAPFPIPPLILTLMPPSPAPAATGFWHPRASPAQGLDQLLFFSASSSSSPPPSLLAIPRAV